MSPDPHPSHSAEPSAEPSSAPLPVAPRSSLWGQFRRPKGRQDTLTLIGLLITCLLISIVALLLMVTSVRAMPLSAGDRLQLVVDAGEEFSGRYQIDVLGRIQLPYAGPVMLAGLEPDVAARAIVDRLVSERLFKRSFARATVQVLAWAPLEIRVSGAVFSPGAHRVNLPRARDAQFDRGEELPGATLPERKLSDALRAAGGVTPWADIAHVALRREGVTKLYNLWGVVLGVPGDDPPLIAGDEVFVAVSQEMQPGLARISPITPPGIKIYVSNLIVPANSNSSATTNSGQMSLAYGARWSQGVISANCVGGTVPTNAHRGAVLVRTDRNTGRTQTWDAPVEDVIRNRGTTENPLLQEGDGVACYDASVTGVRDVFRVLTDIINPISLIRHLP